MELGKHIVDAKPEEFVAKGLILLPINTIRMTMLGIIEMKYDRTAYDKVWNVARMMMFNRRNYIE